MECQQPCVDRPEEARRRKVEAPAYGSRRGRALKTLFAFTLDLRTRDHAGLAEAARTGEIVPVLIVDPARVARLRASPRRAAFYCAAVAALDASIRAAGARLIVRRGPTGSTLRSLARGAGAATVAWSIRYDAQEMRIDRDVQSALEESGLRVLAVHDAPVIPPEETALAHRTGEGWRAFVPYFECWHALVPAPAAPDVRFALTQIASEALPEPSEFGERGVPLPAAAPADAEAKLAAFVAGPILAYGITRNVPAAGPTSELSAELSFGTISARAVVRAACERASDPFLLVEERMAVRLWLRALAQRDFFLQLAWYNETLADAPLQEKMRHFAFARSHPLLGAWRTGTTGFPLVDAGMRELHATGRMHPRIRAVAASFLCFDLGVDWRVGRDEWDRMLVEDSAALATANWQWIAGVGADLAAFPRIYNPVKQAHRFDPAADYVRRWIPELAGLPDAVIFERRDGRAQMALPLFGERGYPAPILDHEAAARAFIARYRAEVEPPPLAR
jgi:deoxyribodipyrimidine photo-lyase